MWPVVSCLVIAGMLLVSCTTAPAGEPKPEDEELVGGGKGPKYGGVAHIAWTQDPQGWDQAYKTAWLSYTLDITNEKLSQPDWTKGLAGSGEVPLRLWGTVRMQDRAPVLLESWEFPDPLTMVFKVRQGVPFHDVPPVNGREMVPKDVAVSIGRIMEQPGSWLAAAPDKPTSIETTDDSVILKFDKFNASWATRVLPALFVVPWDMVVDEQGNETEMLRDWRNAVGTGPFQMEDYIEGGQITFKRFDNYWRADPFPDRSQNRLPYLDGLEVLIIPRVSSQVAALRTGQIEALWGVPWEEAKALEQQNPDLQKGSYTDPSSRIILPVVKFEPWDDIRVRKAMNLALDRAAMVKTLTGGEGEIYFWPYTSAWEGVYYTPFDELPEDAKDSFRYDPERARQLLAEAGYPQGFKTSILTPPGVEEWMSTVVAYWKKIGVEVEIDQRESAAYTTARYGKSYEGLVYSPWGIGFSYVTDFSAFRSGHHTNFGDVADPVYDQMLDDGSTALDPDERARILKEAGVYALQQHWAITLPTPRLFVYWQPWLKGYEGVFNLGAYAFFEPFAFTWIDRG